jgi:aminopeptidase N
MDEGLVSILQQFALMTLVEGEQEFDHLFNKMGLGIQTGVLSDLPLMVPSVYLNDFNYGQASYSKPAFVFALVMEYLGEELFLDCSREFIARWAGKSPTPYDLFYTFEDVSGQDLHWIWKPWFFEFGYADVKIDSFSEGLLSISMAGNQPMPLVIDLEFQDGRFATLYESVGIWSDGSKAYTVNIPEHTEVKGLVVNRDIPDADRSDNTYRTGF